MYLSIASLVFYSALTVVISPKALAEEAKIVSCSTYDTDPAELKLNEFVSRKKFSGLVISDLSQSDETMQFIAKNINRADYFYKLMGRDYADLTETKVLSQRLLGKTFCVLVVGKIVFRGQVTSDFFPAQSPSGIPREALEKERFFVPLLSVGILEGSFWTQQEIEIRFKKIRKVFLQCGIEFEKLEIKTIPNPNHVFDEINDDMDLRDSRFIISPFERKIGSMLAPAQIRPPTLLYLKDVWDVDLSNKLGPSYCAADAHTFLSGEVVKDSPLREMSFIPDVFSSHYFGRPECVLENREMLYLVDAHELGHLLLNDGGHSLDRNNLMFRNAYIAKSTLEESQCAIMRASPFVRRQSR